MSETGGRYQYEAHTSYAVVTLLPELNSAQWADIEQAGTDLINRLESQKAPALLLDLSPLDYMGSPMVALIVRCWKSLKTRDGRLVVVCTNEVVREVIDLAGLTKVWPLVESREEALQALGVGGSRGSSWLIVTSLVAVIVALVGAGLFLTSAPVDDRVSLGLLFGGAAGGFLTGLIALMRETTARRYVGLGVILASAAVAVFGFLRM